MRIKLVYIISRYGLAEGRWIVCSIRLFAAATRSPSVVCAAPPARLDLSETVLGIVASESTAKFETSITEHLNEMVLASPDVEAFLHELARVSARSLSEPGDEVLCGITLLRHRKAATVASSTPEAQAMDEIQYDFGDGPCMTASREQVTVHIPDLEGHARWPQ